MKQGELPDRAIAALIDGVILTFACETIQKALLIPATTLGSFELSGSALLGLILPVVYYGLMEGSARSATIGKQVMDLSVLTADGKRLSYGASFARAATRLVPVGWILALGEKGRALHDYVAGSNVVVTTSE
jgi:uncharacterized RDD family membrane protein YckC